MSDLIRNVSSGGQICTAVTANAGDQALYVGPGRLCSVIITTGGTTFTRFYDSATTSGAVGAVQIFATAQTTTSSTGARTDVQMPFTNGLVIANLAAGAGVTVTFNKATAYGR